MTQRVAEGEKHALGKVAMVIAAEVAAVAAALLVCAGVCTRLGEWRSEFQHYYLGNDITATRAATLCDTIPSDQRAT